MNKRNQIQQRVEIKRFKRALLEIPGWSLPDLLPGDVLNKLIEQASCIGSITGLSQPSRKPLDISSSPYYSLVGV